MPRILHRLLAAALLALVAGCASPAPPPPVHKAPAPDQGAPKTTTGRIEFACEPATATVTVDGQVRGTVGEIGTRGGLELERGLHRIEIAADGFRTFRLELNLGEKRETIRVKLIRIDAKP
jgi:hypothetical protein